MNPHDDNRHARALTAGVLVAIAALGLGVTRVGAQDIGTLESRIASARSEAQGVAAEIEANTAQLATARARASAAAQRESELTAVLAEGQERAAALAEKVSAAEARLVEARRRLGRAIDLLEKRLVAIYKGEFPDATTLILESDGFEDLVTRADYLERIEDADAQLVARVRELRDQVESQLAAVREARAQQEAFNQRVADARAEISAVRADAEDDAAALASARAAQAEALSGLRSQVDDWTAQVQELERVSEAQAQERVGDWFGDWAIPTSIVMCESGGSFDAVNPTSGAGGAYQILPSTWDSYGGEGVPNNASPQAQHDIAAQIWQDSGGSAWVCAG
jgi:peptidoglycan hydrolase CwlO-like protein